MKQSPKKSWFLNSGFLKTNDFKKIIFLFILLQGSFIKAQNIANYVNDGSFEICKNCSSFQFNYLPKLWLGIDSTKSVFTLLGTQAPMLNAPVNNFAYQWPRTGNNYLLSVIYARTPTVTKRGYPRNTLKQNLQSGKTYCVKFYYSITNQSPYGIDGLGAYFGDISTDTISQCDKPISYLIPQVQNPTNNILSDTLNWALLTGTFTANGTEKYVMLGNFKSDANTNSVVINPTNLPTIACEILYDDVSCIDIDLPAFAGSDAWLIPGDSAFIGRQPDVGIDEACVWYKLPNTTTAIDTVAGLWVKPIITTTYVVKQEICAGIKYDTVVVHQSGVGLSEHGFKNEFKISPNPAAYEIEIEFANETAITKPKELKIIDVLGKEVKQLFVYGQKTKINTANLQNGVYFISIKNELGGFVSKKIIIAK